VSFSSNWNLWAVRPSALFSTAFFMRFMVQEQEREKFALLGVIYLLTAWIREKIIIADETRI